MTHTITDREIVLSTVFQPVRANNLAVNTVIRWAKAPRPHQPLSYHYGVIVGIECVSCWSDDILLTVRTTDGRLIPLVLNSFSRAAEVMV